MNADIAETKPARPVDAERARKRTVQRAVKLLAAKPRSIGELRARLLEKQWTNEEAADYAIKKLEEYGYLNDQQFAEQFASYRIKQKPIGRGRLALDLSRKHIDRDMATNALDKVFAETPESDLIDEAIARYTATRGAPHDRKEQKRLIDFLMRRGFSYDLISPRVRVIQIEDEEDDS